jgi:hypothetical protein
MVGSETPLCIAASSCVNPSIQRRPRIMRPKSEAFETGHGPMDIGVSGICATSLIVENSRTMSSERQDINDYWN